MDNNLRSDNLKGNRPRGRARPRWKANIKVDTVQGAVACTYLAEDRDQCRALVSMVMNLRVQQNEEMPTDRALREASSWSWFTC
jgi:hypothetical protein